MVSKLLNNIQEAIYQIISEGKTQDSNIKIFISDLNLNIIKNEFCSIMGPYSGPISPPLGVDIGGDGRKSIEKIKIRMFDIEIDNTYPFNDKIIICDKEKACYFTNLIKEIPFSLNIETKYEISSNRKS